MYSPFCGGRWLKTNPSRETCLSWTLSVVLSLLGVAFTCCVLGEAVSVRHHFNTLIQTCCRWFQINAGVSRMGSSFPYHWKLFVPGMLFHLTGLLEWVPSESGENSALHPESTWLAFGVPSLHESVILFLEQLRCHAAPDCCVQLIPSRASLSISDAEVTFDSSYFFSYFLNFKEMGTKILCLGKDILIHSCYGEYWACFI